MEIVGQKAIVYSGGAFVDDYAGDNHYRNDLSAVMVANFASATAAAGAQRELDSWPARDQGPEQQQQQQRPTAVAGDGGPAGATTGSALSPLPAAAAANNKGSSQFGVASAAAASQGSCPAGLVLQTLHALPIAITHHWRTEGGPFSKEGLGNPPYFSQVRSNMTEPSMLVLMHSMA